MTNTGSQLRASTKPPAVQIHSRQGKHVAFTVDMGAKSYDIFFRSEQVELCLSPEALTAVMLIPCMASGLDWSVEDSIDADFASNIDTIQSIYNRWFAPLQRIQLIGEQSKRTRTDDGRSALFFSGGLDSFDSLEKNVDAIDDLIFLKGFDIDVADEKLWYASVDNAAQTARSYGKRLLTVESNIRQLLDDYLNWGDSHGAVLAAVAHLLSPRLSRVFIASSYAYEQLFPWGSHPLLDPLWSSSTLQVVHDGCASNRVQKAQRVAQSQKALASIRVCWKGLDEGLNCGKCEKCIRTMINFELAGLEDYQRMFPTQLTPKLVKSIRGLTGSQVIFARENVAALRATGQRPDIANALEKLLRRNPRLYAMKKQLRQRKRQLIARLGELVGASWYQDTISKPR